jgi:hypothetical protein
MIKRSSVRSALSLATSVEGLPRSREQTKVKDYFISFHKEWASSKITQPRPSCPPRISLFLDFEGSHENQTIVITPVAMFSYQQGLGYSRMQISFQHCSSQAFQTRRCLTEGAGVEECPAVIGHLKGRPRSLAEELLKGRQTARQLLMLRHDSSVLLLQIADVLCRLGQDRALDM